LTLYTTSSFIFLVSPNLLEKSLVRTIANVRLVLWLSSLLPHFVCFFSLCLLVSIYRFYSLLLSVSLPLYLNFYVPLYLFVTVFKSFCLTVATSLSVCFFSIAISTSLYYFYVAAYLTVFLSVCIFCFFFSLSLYVSACLFCVSLCLIGLSFSFSVSSIRLSIKPSLCLYIH